MVVLTSLPHCSFKRKIGEEEERKRRGFARNLRTVAILMFAPIAKAHAGFFLGYMDMDVDMDPPRRGSSKDLACL